MSRQLVQYHPVIGHLFIPDLKTRVAHEAGGYLFQSNAQGFRSRHDFAAPRQAGTRRILVFGDSFTAGDGVSNSQRYTEQLETALPGTEVFNFGLSGSGTDQQYLCWREFGRTLEADHVVIAIQPENIRRNASAFRLNVDPSGAEVYYPKPYALLQDGHLDWRHQPVPTGTRTAADLPEDARADTGGRFRPVRQVVNALGVKALVQRLTHFQPQPEYDEASSPDWQLMRAILLAWIRQIAPPVTLLHVPLYHYVEGVADATHVQARLGELAAEAGVPLVDPLPGILTLPEAERRAFRFATDIHPTPAYHACLARALMPALTPAAPGR